MANKQNLTGWADTEMIDWESDPGTDDVIIPDVTGWRVLVWPLKTKDTTAGGILLAEETKEKEQLTVTVGKVLQVGPMAYKREDMGEPWCKQGDYVIFGKYNGKKMLFKGVPLIILNDDEILGVVTAI